MAALFPTHPEAIENTERSPNAAMWNSPSANITCRNSSCRRATIPRHTSGSCAAAALPKKYADRPECRKQLDYELDMIEKMGFTDYFLIVADFVNYAKQAGIPVGPGRGSAAGSMVSYCLNITEIDPMQYSLYFERFLNPERVSMPDIDMDFGDTRRDEVFDYVRRKYGDDHVAHIVTFGTMAARGAIRDVGRVMNLPYADVDIVAKQVPATLHITLDDALRISKPLRDLYEGDERYKTLIDTARALEGMPRHASTHAAGVVITKRPVVDYVPLSKNDDTVVCQYTMTTLEELGLLKMDFLGLRNLTVLDDAVKMLQKDHPEFRLKDIPEDDAATYEMIGAGKTSGVFQMESAGMTGVCVSMKPQNIEDITAIIALYRPGPHGIHPQIHRVQAASGKNRISAPGPGADPVQYLRLHRLPGAGDRDLSPSRRLFPGQADMVRRAISKKKAAQIQKEKEAFIRGDAERGIAGCIRNGIPEETAEQIYQQIYDFANYAFNKAHAVSYAVVAYQTAIFQVPLSKGIHGGTADLRSRQYGQDRGVHRRVQRLRYPALSAGHQPFRRHVHRRTGRHPLRPGGHQKCGPRPDPGRGAGAGARRGLHLHAEFLRAHVRGRPQ